jgi:hypothetical protein
MSAQLIHEGTRVRMTQPAGSPVSRRLRSTWHQIRLTVAEMNYAARRVVEIQAPWGH